MGTMTETQYKKCDKKPLHDAFLWMHNSKMLSYFPLLHSLPITCTEIEI